MGKKEDEAKLRFHDELDYNHGYRQPRSSLGCKYLMAIVIALCFGVLCGLAGYYIGQMNSEDDLVTIDDGGLEPVPEPTPGDYFVGVGRYDVTGPIAQVNMMGYANPSQVAHGLHLRLYSRAFIFSDLEKKKRVVFVSIDSGMMSQSVKLEVVKKLKAKYGDMYDEKNVVLSGTHSHSGPAGFFQFLLFEVTSLGFIKESQDSFVDGIVKSIDIAHDSMQEGFIHVLTGDVHEGNINRSPSAYLHNPESERAKYQYNTEQEMTVLKIEASTGEQLGLVTWYPVHGTSMNNTNELISSDNKGRASSLYEKKMNVNGRTNFVSAFAQANLGDVSPNTAGPKCIDTGEACDFEKSTCGFPPRVQNCIAFGPGLYGDMIESTDIIGHRQLVAAEYIVGNSTGDHVLGDVNFSHQYVDMTKEEVTLADGSKSTTCKPAMGYSFAAGTTDGPGAMNFVQSMTEGTFLWNTVRDIIGRIVCSTVPTQADYDCHKPKPVLLPTGFMDRPYAWHPSIVDVQLLRVGQLVIAAVPGEFTTMAGRRLKDAIKAKAIALGMPSNTKVVIAGLSNVYTHYITTLEEFGAQRYEGASTIYGPHTHAAYMARFTNLMENLVKGTEADPGPTPDDLMDKQIELLPKPRPDTVPEGKKFGDVIVDAEELYAPYSNVSVTFYGANPRNNMHLGTTYLEVQMLKSDHSAWVTMFTDADWETKFKWQRMKKAGEPSDTGGDIITAIMKMIEKITGIHINLERLESLMNAGEFSREDLNVEMTSDGQLADKEGFIAKLTEKGILLPGGKWDLESIWGSDESHVTIDWVIPGDQPLGLYRIVYHGDQLAKDGTVTPFTGMSREFQIRE